MDQIELPLYLGNHKKGNYDTNVGRILHIIQSILDSSMWREQRKRSLSCQISKNESLVSLLKYMFWSLSYVNLSQCKLKLGHKLSTSVDLSHSVKQVCPNGGCRVKCAIMLWEN